MLQKNLWLSKILNKKAYILKNKKILGFKKMEKYSFFYYIS